MNVVKNNKEDMLEKKVCVTTDKHTFFSMQQKHGFLMSVEGGSAVADWQS